MPDQRLTAKNAAGAEQALGAIQEADLTTSLQVADPIQRQRLLDLNESLVGAMNQLEAAAAAMTLAANADQASADTVMAHTAQLIAAGNQIQTEATALLAALNQQLTALTNTESLIQLMAQSMQVSFNSLEDVRALVQSMLNAVSGMIASAPGGSSLAIEPIGDSRYGSVNSVPADIETVVCQLVVPVDSTMCLSGFTATGSTDAVFKLYIDTLPKLIDRTSAAEPTARGQFPSHSYPRAGANAIVKVTVKHASPRSQDFEAFIHGFFTP